MFIVFEGIDGSGKSTISKKVFSVLKNKNLKTIFTKEPSGTIFKKKIKNLALSLDSKYFESQILLFEAERIVHLKSKIIPSLKEKKIVITDRFIDSTIVYQGLNNNFDIKKILNLHEEFAPKIIPDLTFYFYANENDLLKRIKLRKNNDKFDEEVLNNIKKYKNYYEKIYEEYYLTKKLIKINSSEKSIESSVNDIVEEILKNL